MQRKNNKNKYCACSTLVRFDRKNYNSNKTKITAGFTQLSRPYCSLANIMNECHHLKIYTKKFNFDVCDELREESPKLRQMQH